MSRTPQPTMRQLSAFVTVFTGVAIVVIGWAVWKLTPAGGATEARPPGVAAASTRPAPDNAPAQGRSNVAVVGAPAPDFTLTLFDTGETITLSDLRGQPVILDFFASWCSSCRAEAPSLEEFWQAYQSKGLTLLGVAIDDSAEGLRDFKDEFFLTYPMGLDETGEVAAMYRVSSIPTFVMIDRDGQIANVVIGGMSRAAMAAEAEALLK